MSSQKREARKSSRRAHLRTPKNPSCRGRFAASRSGCWTRSRRLPVALQKRSTWRPLSKAYPMWPPSMNSFRARSPHIERAVQLAPDFIAPRVWLVAGLAQLGETASVRVHLRELERLALGASPFDRALIEWAKATARGDLEAKVSHLRVALVYSPHNNVLLYNLGATLYLLGRPTEAVPPIREAVQSGWRFAPLYTLWGVLAIQSGALEGLRDTLEGARSIIPSESYLAGLLEALAIFEGDTAATQRYQAAFRAELGAAHLAEGMTEMIPIYQALARRTNDAGKTKARAILLERVAEAERLRALGRGGSRPRTNHKED